MKRWNWKEIAFLLMISGWHISSACHVSDLYLLQFLSEDVFIFFGLKMEVERAIF